MGEQVGLYGKEYEAVKPPSSYPDLLIGGSRNRDTALTAEARIQEWQNRPEYIAKQAALAEQTRQRAHAENVALFDAVMARRATAAPATAIADVAQVNDDQAAKVKIAIGTV